MVHGMRAGAERGVVLTGRRIDLFRIGGYLGANARQRSIDDQPAPDAPRVLTSECETDHVSAVVGHKVRFVHLQSIHDPGNVAYPADLRASEKIRTLTTWLRRAFGDPPHWELPSRERHNGDPSERVLA
jgi:hypothetical protein